MKNADLCRTCDGQGEWTDRDEDQVICYACNGSGHQDNSGSPCPSCGDRHPGGVGLDFCFCRDCRLLFGSVPKELLAPQFRDRLDELIAAALEVES